MHALHPARLIRWLDIEPEEVRPAALCFAITFSWGFAQMLNWTAANTLFLQHYDASELPIVSIASAALIPLSGLLFIRLNRWMPFSRQFLLFASMFVVVPVLFRLLLGGTEARWPSLAFSVWYYLDVAFAALLGDAFLNRMFNLRQAKRVFGPISTGADLAGVPAGLMVGLIVGRWGVENLLLVAAAISALVLLLFAYASHVFRDRVESGDVDEDEETGDGEAGRSLSIGALLRNPLVLCIIAMEAIGEFNLEFLNNAFYAQTEAYHSDPAEMAAFLGTFFAIASVVSSVVQMAASSRLMRSLGISGCLVLGPSLLALTLLAFLASSWIGMAPAFVFGCMASAKFVQYTVMVNVNDAAQFTLVRSLPPILQDRTLALSGTVLSPILGGASGLALLGMIHVFGAGSTGIASVTALMLIAVIAIALRAARAYRENLRQMVEARAIPGVALSFDDPAMARTLREMLGASDPGTAAFALEILSRNPQAGFAPDVATALAHPDPAVRRGAALALLRIPEPPPADALRRALPAERDASVRAALIDALARGTAAPGAEAVFAPHLDDADPDVRLAAAAGLAQNGSAEARARVLALASAAAASDAPSERAWSARLIARLGAPAPADRLLPLLADPSLPVRAAAIAAAARLPGQDTAAAIAANLLVPELRAAVAAAMATAEPDLLAGIDAACDATGSSEALREAIVHLLGSLGTAEAARLLEQRLEDPSVRIQEAVVTALAAAHYRPGDAGRRRLAALQEQRAARARWLMRACLDLGGLEGAGRLATALDRELRGEKERLFAILGLLHPGEGVDRIRHACLDSGSEDREAAGIELLEGLLRSAGQDSLLPIFEGGSLERRLTALARYAQADARTPADHLCALLSDDGARAGRWLTAMVLDFLARTPALQPQVSLPAGGGIETALAWTRARPGDRLPVIDRVAALSRSPVFDALPEDLLVDCAALAREREAAPNEILFHEGEPGATLCVLVEGALRVQRGARHIATLAAGSVVGELSALLPEPRSASVEAIEHCLLLELDAAVLERVLDAHPEGADGILRVLATRIRESIDAGTSAMPQEDLAPATGAGLPTRMLEDLEKLDCLRRVALFSSLPDALLLPLARLATEQWIEAGQDLFTRGDVGSAMYLVVDGQLQVRDGERTIARIHRGEIAGELALLTSEVRSSTVTAGQPSRLLRITRSVLRELMWEHPALRRAIVGVLVSRLRAMTAAGPAAESPAVGCT